MPIDNTNWLTSPTGYPERILIYHTGTARTVYLGFVKITTLFLFAFSSLIVAPRFYYSPDEPNWTAVVGRYHYGQVNGLLGTNK